MTFSENDFEFEEIKMFNFGGTTILTVFVIFFSHCQSINNRK